MTNRLLLALLLLCAIAPGLRAATPTNRPAGDIRRTNNVYRTNYLMMVVGEGSQTNLVLVPVEMLFSNRAIAGVWGAETSARFNMPIVGATSTANYSNYTTFWNNQGSFGEGARFVSAIRADAGVYITGAGGIYTVSSGNFQFTDGGNYGAIQLGNDVTIGRDPASATLGTRGGLYVTRVGSSEPTAVIASQLLLQFTNGVRFSAQPLARTANDTNYVLGIRPSQAVGETNTLEVYDGLNTTVTPEAHLRDWRQRNNTTHGYSSNKSDVIFMQQSVSRTDFVEGVFYTNTTLGAWQVQASLLVKCFVGVNDSMSLSVDDTADGSIDSTVLGGIQSSATVDTTNTVVLSAVVLPGGRFTFTNLGGFSVNHIVANTSRRVRLH